MVNANGLRRRSSTDPGPISSKKARHHEQPLASMAEANEIYDLIILVDATYSMSNYLASLQSSLPKIIAISALTDAFSRIGIIAYKDYCDRDVVLWSGWNSSNGSGSRDDDFPDCHGRDLLSYAKNLEPMGGGDYPEATKTGLAKAYQEMRADATTIILLYTDAPPHLVSNGSKLEGNWWREQQALSGRESYGGFGSLFLDWVNASKTMAGKADQKRAQVFSILEPRMSRADGDNYTFLSTITGGACLYLKHSRPQDISQVTVDLLLAWMGAEKAGAVTTAIAAKLSKFTMTEGIDKVQKEATKGSKQAAKTDELSLDSAVLKKYLPKRKTPVQDFAQRYKTDKEYKNLVVREMQKIIDFDVSAIALNPVFGSLWRTVCNDRDNPKRDGLISSFGLKIERIVSEDEKARMKIWLEESYDYSAEVQEAIESVPVNQRYPCVYLDPTLTFAAANHMGSQEAEVANHSGSKDDEVDRAITDFRRDELLEIGRSCDYKILRRLGRVLTRLNFVKACDEVPVHIMNADEGTAVQIPLALGKKEFGRKFWRILLHIVVPGTMLSARPAALLAALSIRLGVEPLSEAAETEMLLWRDKWNNLEIPETWNSSCLSLLLDADKAYRGRQRNEKDITNSKGLLNNPDRELFDRLVSYMLLERNLATTLTAKVSWKPEKATLPIGPLVLCRSCHYPRSVTMMSARGKCGICATPDPENAKERQVWTDARVSKEDNAATNATWVECGIRTCRAQYVVYHPEASNVRPKCYYCRAQADVAEKFRSDDPAPWLECKQCLNRVIYPEEYRTNIDAPFKCVACSNGRASIDEVDTNAKVLSAENGTAWLLENKDQKLKDPLGGRTLFHQISQAGVDDFCSKVAVFPSGSAQTLTLAGKPLHNTSDVIKQLQAWVYGRRTESGTCSLCFSSKRKTDLHPACGRRGCEQRICSDCLKGWYGLNAAGRIINVAALSCPFCRRTPTAKTLHGYGMGIHAVGDLRAAVENAGQWIYAWCTGCVKAKQYLERVCARGAPPEVDNWVCEQCLDERKTAASQKHRSFRECPKCGVMTEKSYGCGHMSCRCGAHWCWFCGEDIGYSRIYRHMDEVHGSWFEGNDNDEDEENGDESD